MKSVKRMKREGMVELPSCLVDCEMEEDEELIRMCLSDGKVA